MTTINIIAGLCVLSLAWFAWLTWKEDHRTDEPDQREEEIKDVVKVEDIDIGHAIYDLFPEWTAEFKSDPMMDEIAATCDLYLAAKELLRGGAADVKLIVILDDAVHKFEKYAL